MKKTESENKKALRFQKLLAKETELLNTFDLVAGVDEAGRGPLCGPVVCAAAMHGKVFPSVEEFPWLMEIFDSKQLSESKREYVFERLMSSDSPFEISIAMADAKEIDETNILRATHRAMKSAVLGLKEAPGFVLVDGTAIPDLGIPQEKVIKGDSLCLAVAAASIAAKVTRDHIMLELDELYPGYDLAKNKGYGTAFHLKALQKLGRSPIHRKTFYVEGLDEDRGAKKGKAGGGSDRKGAQKKRVPDNLAQLSLFEE